jgi:hypothetical protein
MRSSKELIHLCARHFLSPPPFFVPREHRWGIRAPQGARAYP